ncbi:MAG: hypothetical protein AB1810_07205 [Pseudomonadota bacterium]
MSSGLELYNSRINHLTSVNGATVIHFSVAYILKVKGIPGCDPGSEWSQEANIVLEDATISGAPPPLPNTVADGFLEVDGKRYEVIPIPLHSKNKARLSLRFVDNTEVDIVGTTPRIDLSGTPIFLEEIR